MIRSVMEGVAFSQRDCIEVFREMGIAIDDICMLAVVAPEAPCGGRFFAICINAAYLH